jgi:DNA mismatch repair protein MLH3
MDAIRPLPTDVAAQIKSSTTITSLNSAVVGLLENALDAGATHIEISVNYERAACTVEDDGHGISPENFQPDGALGRPYRGSGPRTRYTTDME